MLHLILGVSGSGKTTLLYQKLRQRAEAGLYSILLVPEQFTSSTEGRIYHQLGDTLSGYVESLSFTSLAERILSAEGGSAIRTLSDAGRAVLVRRAMEELQDNLKYYARHRRSAAFCQMAAETIDELKSAGLNGETLHALARNCGVESEKLEEIALILSGYDTLLAGTGLDPADRLTLAAERLEAARSEGRLPAFLEGREVFIDEFDTFNAPKKRLLGEMLSALPGVTVALCDDDTPQREGDLSLFSGAKAVARELRQLARKNGCPVAEPHVCRIDHRHAAAPALAAVGELIISGRCDWPEDRPAPELRIYPAPSREEEARAAVGAVRKLMRQGVRCGKMAVVCRDVEAYRAAVRYEFRMAGIPLWCDEPTTPEFCAPANAVRALLRLVRGLDYSAGMTALAKTGLCSLTEAQVCALENYVFTWSPKAAEWRQPFAKSPRGFGEASALNDEEKHNLALAEEARAFLMARVDALRDKTRSCNAVELSRALYFCLTDLGADVRQAEQVEQLRLRAGIPVAEEAAREWNVLMDLLTQMAELLGESAVDPAEYEDLFGLLLRSADLGHIPQTLDAVILTSAGKMRLDEPEYVFLLGMAEGEFPRAPGEAGLLSHADRDALIKQEISLPDCFENRVVREQVCFYKAMTCASKGLWLSWPEGQGLPLCAAAEPIRQALRPQLPVLALEDMAATPAAALDCLGGGYPLDEPARAALKAALSAEEDRLALLDRISARLPRRVEDLPAMERLLGSRLRISPSQMEKYYTCRYGYFLQYVLGLRPRKKAELSPDQSGTLMHWVLEKALDPNPGEDNPAARWGDTPFARRTDNQLAELAAGLVDEYAARYLPEESTRFRYLLSRLKKSMASLLCYLRDEQAQSEFHPVACELKIGEGEGCVPPQVYQLSNGRRVQVIGTIDRTDEWVEADGTRWVRVVDYKTGGKKFDLREVYCGLDCQMLLYLFSLTKDSSGRFTGAEPAGVLYLLADPAPASATRAEAQKQVDYQLDGLIRDEDCLFTAMDAERTGRYLPFSFPNGKPHGNTKNKRADAGKIGRIQAHLEGLVTGMAEQLYEGRIEAEPLITASRSPCSWCDFRAVCCHEDGLCERELNAPKDPFGAEDEIEKEDAE